MLHNPWAEKLVHKILLLDRPRMNILPLYRFKLHSIHFSVSLNCYIVILQIPAYVSGRFISFIWANKWVYYSFFGLQTIKRIIKISMYRVIEDHPLLLVHWGFSVSTCGTTSHPMGQKFAKWTYCRYFLERKVYTNESFQNGQTGPKPVHLVTLGFHYGTTDFIRTRRITTSIKHREN